MQETELNELTCQRELLIGGSSTFSPIFFDKDIPVLTPGTIFNERNLQ